jgi:transcriptional regulator GlxA family with amidase domain
MVISFGHMKHVSILVPRGHFSMVNLEGSHQMLNWVNGFLTETGRQPVFRIQLVGLERPTWLNTGLFAIHPDLLLDEVKRTDLVILPAIFGDVQQNLEWNRELIPWLVKQYKAGAEIASMCIGSMFLAATGLLDGRACSTHWQFANQFRMMYPRANLMDDRILTEADGIYTSGGAYSFTNLLVYLIEKYAGREVAIVAAKAFMIDIDRSSQSPFAIFAGQKAHSDEDVLQVQEFIEQNYSDHITVDFLTHRFGIGRRTFERRFKLATANTVVEYIQRVKMEAAKKQLESGRKTVNEVMYEVGYSDTKAFREVFRRCTGMSPVDYRNKYNKELVANQN